jgi:hypothetical protein
VPSTSPVAPSTTAPAPTTAPSPPVVVTASVSVPSAGVAADLVVGVSELAPDQLDPFGLFVACSGLEPSVANYSVTVSDPSAEVTAISVISVEPVTVAGVYDADVRVERAAGGAIDGVGTMLLDEGLRSGTFMAFDVLGNEISGEFRCEGSPGGPTPLPVGPDDGILDSVEVVARLRRDASERLVDIATTAGEVDADCPGATGAAADLLVRVDTTTGSLTTFELNGGDAPAMRMRVGGTTHEFSEVTTDAEPGDTAGTFTAEAADGLSVVGAFRCT